jgi:hypothetical protein
MTTKRLAKFRLVLVVGSCLQLLSQYAFRDPFRVDRVKSILVERITGNAPGPTGTYPEWSTSSTTIKANHHDGPPLKNPRGVLSPQQEHLPIGVRHETKTNTSSSKIKSNNKKKMKVDLDLKTTTKNIDTDSQSKPPVQSSPSTQRHVVFVGDSLLRYSYLEWLDHRHKKRRGEGGDHDDADGDDDNDFCPPELINEKIHESWQKYFEWSTEHFDGHMTCDCQRSDERWELGREMENRYYRSSAVDDDGTTNTTSWYATYIQGYGDNEAHGRNLPGTVYNASITKDKLDGTNTTGWERVPAEQFEWRYNGPNWPRMMIEYVANLKPKPTAIVINLGLWPHYQTNRRIRRILEAAYNATNHEGIVIWRGITPQQDNLLAHPSEADKAGTSTMNHAQLP